jgi:hypothetical protein
VTGFFSQWLRISPYIRGPPGLVLLCLKKEEQPASETCFYKTLDERQSPKKKDTVSMSHAPSSRFCSVELHSIYLPDEDVMLDTDIFMSYLTLGTP